MFGRPTRFSRPEQNCLAPKPREVASPNNVASAASESMSLVITVLFFGKIL